MSALMEATALRYSESDVLRWLEQSARVLDDIRRSVGGWQDVDACPIAEQRAILDKLGVVSQVLQYLRQRIIPSLLSGNFRDTLHLEKALRDIDRQAQTLELHFKAAPRALN